jgi:hypothetical protein
MRHTVLAGESFRADTWRITGPLRIRSRCALIPPSIESVQLPKCLGHGWQKEVGDIRESKIPNFINLEYREEFSSQLLAISRSMDQTLETCAPAHVQRRLTWITGRVPALPALL